MFLFFPDDLPALGQRSQALLEICFTGSLQQTSLPAVVRSHEFDTASGSWLELRSLGVVAGLQSAIVVPKRSWRRLAFDQLAWVSYAAVPVLACPVLDIGKAPGWTSTEANSLLNLHLGASSCATRSAKRAAP